MLVPTTTPGPVEIEIDVTEEEILADLLFPAPLPAPGDKDAEERIR
jgi:hypothetical protein